MFFGVKL